MIKSSRHKGLEKFFKVRSKAGIQPQHAARLRIQLTALNIAETPEDMNVPGWKLHRLKGDKNLFWAVWVDKNWRLIFRFQGQDVEHVDYLDYH
ncbi:MAG: type II toxin-antitoxin system RelE/ParE family toxin [Gammaproteobacteria bacterium]|nr:type II toxin-antitoxin system RelE/ParE family toxin [Gammaproteobacteria bacterium]